MKTYNNLFSSFISSSNFYNAFYKARKAKPYSYNTLNFQYDLEKNIYNIINCLKNNNYNLCSKDYTTFIIYEPKKRIIKSLDFKHKVIQFALYNIIEPIFEKSFIYHSYACRKNKGTHKCIKNISELVSKKSTKYKFCLKCDVKKYFQSIDHNILKRIISKKIKDKNILNILNILINSDHSCFGNNKGIPIGNLSSQLFANIYLNELDQYVKHKLKIKSYFRYMDDFIIFSDTKQKLYVYKSKIKAFLKKQLILEIPNNKCSIYPISCGINFLGYYIFKNNIRIRRKNYVNFIKRTKLLINKYDLKLISFNKLKSSVCSYLGYCKLANTFKLNIKIFNNNFKNELYLFKNLTLKLK
jgi:retron-type reverse transcriptase